MPDYIDLINYASVISGMTISIMGLIFTFRAQYMSSWIRNYFKLFFGILIVYTFSNAASQISLVFLGDGYRTLTITAIFCESFFSSLLMPLLNIYILHNSGRSLRCRMFYTVFFLWCLYLVMLIYTQFSTTIYYVTEDNVYHRGPYYPLLLVPAVLLMLINMVGLFNIMDQLSKRTRNVLFLNLLIPTVAMLIQMHSYGVLLIVFGTSVSALILFNNIVNEEAERYIDQKIALSEQVFKTKTLQIRPHFIYNTMSSIYYLCEIDPKKAQKLVDDFSSYLKKNYSAMVKEGLIPFNEELTHTRAYLNVIKARYEDMIFVDYDTPHIAFRLPPLTLEPVVENAVKHGLDPDSDPLHILIRTGSTADGNILIVENSGTDYLEEQTEDNDPHIGLDNVRSRLSTLCDGTLSIDRREEGGTIVTIFLPEKKGSA